MYKLLTLSVVHASEHRILRPSLEDPRQQARAMLDRMTLVEKAHMLHGNSSDVYEECSGYVGCVPRNSRLNIPALRMQDGPQGFRHPEEKYYGTSTEWPSGVTMGMSWDADLLWQWGEAIAHEFLDKGANVMFGPAVHVHRVPSNGRNFEYISGEDPFLGKILTKSVVEGIQSTGMIANVKHYIANDQEGWRGPDDEPGAGDRHVASSNVDERTIAEIYMPPFEGAIEGGVLSVMCGNNLVNGEHICENNYMLNTMLREYNGFRGFICTDYRGGQTTLGAAFGGLDLQLPGCKEPNFTDPSGLSCEGDKRGQRPNYYGQPLLDALKAGMIPHDLLDEKVEHILYAMFASGAMARDVMQTAEDSKKNVTSAEHNRLAHTFALQSAVLLQNTGSLLPLSVNSIPGATETKYTIAVIGPAGHDDLLTGGGGSGHVTGPYRVSVFSALREALGRNAVAYYGGEDASRAGQVASESEYAIVVVGSLAAEGRDRTTLEMNHSHLIEAVALRQPNTVVVVASPGAFLASWADSVPAILAVFYSGQEHGRAVTDILLGKHSPSGKLTLTIPNKENEIGFSEAQYPGTEFEGNCTIGWDFCYNVTYSEKLEVGYRWYNAHNVQPRFPFGHGLTYSEFELTNFTLKNRTVILTVKNVGQMTVAEVVQLYLTYPPSEVEEPPRQLRGFAKVTLPAGAEELVTMQLSDRDLSIWNVSSHSWQLVTGKFHVEVGTSSAHLPLSGELEVGEDLALVSCNNYLHVRVCTDSTPELPLLQYWPVTRIADLVPLG